MKNHPTKILPSGCTATDMTVGDQYICGLNVGSTNHVLVIRDIPFDVPVPPTNPNGPHKIILPSGCTAILVTVLSGNGINDVSSILSGNIGLEIMLIVMIPVTDRFP